eukprot:gene1049-10568_t
MKKFLFVFLILVVLFVSSSSQQEEDFWNTVKVVETKDEEKDIGSEEADKEDFSEFDTKTEKINVETKEKHTSAEEKKTETTNETQRPSFFNLPHQEHFYYEIAMGIFTIVYIYVYFTGKSKNQEMAKNWASHFSQLLTDNFSSNAEEKIVLYKDGHSEYRSWSTGRYNCDGYSATISLQKRYDLLSILFGLAFGADDDLITIDIPYPKLEPFIFAIADTDYKEKYQDVKNLASTITNDEIRPFVVYTDSPELASTSTGLLTPQVIGILSKYHRYFVSLHFSDQSEFYSTKCLRFQFKMPSKMEDLDKLMEMTIYYIDLIASIKLKSKEKNLLQRDALAKAESLQANKEKEAEMSRKRKEEKREKLDQKKRKK